MKELGSNTFRLRKELTAANLVSIARPLIVMYANKIGYKNRGYQELMAASYVSDSLDGMLARKFGESPLGGIVDIVSDHIAEALMYQHLSNERVVPKWVVASTVVRNVVVDSLRVGQVFSNPAIIDEQDGVLKIQDSKMSRVVTSGVSRTGYALLKAVVAISAPSNSDLSRNLSKIAAGVNLVRGVPVILNRRNLQMVQKLRNYNL